MQGCITRNIQRVERTHAVFEEVGDSVVLGWHWQDDIL